MIKSLGNPRLLRYHKLFNTSLNLRMPLFIIVSSFFIFLFNVPANAALTSKSYVDTKTAIAGTNMATAGQIAKYVADGATGEMKLEGTTLGDMAGALSVSDILTGTDTTNKLASAQTINVATGGYATTAGTGSAFTATIPGFVLQDGARVRLKMHTNNQINATLNINGTGAKNIALQIGTNNMPFAYLATNSMADFIYDSASDKWMVVGSAMDVGAGDNIRNYDTGAYRRYSGIALKSAMLTYGGAVALTGGTAAAYTINNFTDYTSNAAYLNVGTKIIVNLHTANAAGATLNLNGIGAKAIYFNNAPIAAGLLQVGGIYSFVYDGVKWDIIMSPNAGTIPLPTAECASPGNKCGLTYGSTNSDGSGEMIYTWEVVSR